MAEVEIKFGQPVMFPKLGREVWKDGRLYRHDIPAGSAEWAVNNNDGVAALSVTCPCGCGTVHAMPVCIDVKKEGDWLWNGSREFPSLLPSIQCTTPCGWHGYLTDGIFRPC